MSQIKRLADGGRINRAEPLTFAFDGKEYQGFRGDSLASALLANDVHLVGRSFKYHRPRGIVTAGIEEPSALADINVTPDTEERRDPIPTKLAPRTTGTTPDGASGSSATPRTACCTCSTK